MSEVEQLKEQIQSQLEKIDKRQLRLVQKIIDRLEEVEQCLNHNEPSLTRGNNADSFRSEVDTANLPTTTNNEGQHLKGLVTKAVNVLEQMEQQLSNK